MTRGGRGSVPYQSSGARCDESCPPHSIHQLLRESYSTCGWVVTVSRESHRVHHKWGGRELFNGNGA
eukprot:487565-Prymnesium_polylepis.1